MEKYINKWKEIVTEALNNLFSKETQTKIIESELICEIPPNPSLGDLAFPFFNYAKKFRQSPANLAEQVADYLVKHFALKPANLKQVGPYLNIFLEKEKIIPETIELAFKANSNYGLNTSLAGKRIMLEFSCPNTNKPLHLGHLRNDCLGMSIARILERCGAEVLKVNLINDRGIHICKSMLAYKKFGTSLTPEKIGKKSDHFVGDFYVEFAKQAKENPTLEEEVKAMLKAWEEGDPEVLELWKQMNEWAIAGIKKTYHDTGIEFDRYYYESETYTLGKTEVLRGLEKGVFYKKEDNSIWVDLTEYGLDHKVLLRSDGTSLYLTQDIGTAIKRAVDWPFDQLIYVVASEQNYHFKVLFLVLKILGFKWAEQLYHLSYGMVNLPEGKMKSREGNVVDADDLLAELINFAQEEIRQRQNKIEKEEIYSTAKAIALGALNYYLLSVSPQKDMIFNPKESLSFTGNTGPYLQYTGARISSILRKFEERKKDFANMEINYTLLTQPQEWELVKKIAEYPQIIQKAAAQLDPSLIATNLYESAKIFASYYHENQVLGNTDKKLVLSRIALLKAYLAVLKSGFELLGIPFLESM